ncbi:hypothetical protein SD77_3720 [Bacillus badius]|uniref:Ribose 5-phosphate isomerase B n=1 Tax=Bacillus badius TaxID=1455 RepID=A0ABR5AVZ8_BACBA|nr:hypothetical protein SD77_3720 [Bacillus badius]
MFLRNIGFFPVILHHPNTCHPSLSATKQAFLLHEKENVC